MASSGEKLYLSRRYRFVASHCLYAQELSPEENARIFGKCANPNGHGHNYQLIVTVAGSVDPATGMCFDRAALDHIVEEQVLQQYDHKHLNLDVEDYLDLVPTGENIVHRVWERLDAAIPDRKLHRLKLIETRDNSFERSRDRA